MLYPVKIFEILRFTLPHYSISVLLRGRFALLNTLEGEALSSCSLLALWQLGKTCERKRIKDPSNLNVLPLRTDDESDVLG